MVHNNDSIVRCDSKMEDILVENADIVSKFKFFETYKPDEKEKKKFRITPPRDGVAKVSNVFIKNVCFIFVDDTNIGMGCCGET